jgi:hypothetical protein
MVVHKIQINAISFLQYTTVENKNYKYDEFFADELLYREIYCERIFFYNIAQKLNKLKSKRAMNDDCVHPIN